MSFLDELPHDIIMDSLGDNVVYIQPGQTEGVPIKAIVTHDLQRTFAVDSYRPEPFVNVDVLKDDAPNCKKGAKFLYKGQTLTVEAIESDDGYVIKAVVK